MSYLSRRAPAAVLALLLGVLAVVAVPALVPPATAAAKVTLSAPSSVVAGKPARLTGRARTASVVLRARTATGKPWKKVATAKVRTGAYAFVVRPTRTTWYQVKAGRATSAVRRVQVSAPAPVYTWRTLRGLGSVAASTLPSFESDYSTTIGGVRYSDYNNWDTELERGAGTAFIELDLRGMCTDLSVDLGLVEPYSSAATKIRVLADGVALLDRDFGAGQRHLLRESVRGVRVLRFEARRLTDTGRSLPALAHPEVRCDSRIDARPEGNRTRTWKRLLDLGSVDGSTTPSFASEYAATIGGVRYSDYNNWDTELERTARTAFVTFDLRGRCTRLDVSLGLLEPYSSTPTTIRVLADGAPLLDRDFGAGSRHRLLADVTGVRKVRFEATRLSDDGRSLPVLAQPEALCS